MPRVRVCGRLYIVHITARLEHSLPWHCHPHKCAIYLSNLACWYVLPVTPPYTVKVYIATLLTSFFKSEHLHIALKTFPLEIHTQYETNPIRLITGYRQS